MTTNLPRRGAAAAGLAALGLLAGGCGDPTRARVHGTVTVDGRPVADGMIQFSPADGNGQTAGAPVVDGAYRAEGSPGRMRVTVNAPEVVGKQKAYDDLPDSPLLDVHRERLPARYTSPDKSELTATLEPGDNEVNFDLSTDPKTKGK